MGQRKTLLKSHTHPCQVKIVTMCLFPWLLFRFLRHIIILFFLVFLKGSCSCCLLKKVPVYRGKVTLTLTVLNQQLSTVFSSPEHKDCKGRLPSCFQSSACLFVSVFCWGFLFFLLSKSCFHDEHYLEIANPSKKDSEFSLLYFFTSQYTL